MYQPFASAGRDATALLTGTVESYLKWTLPLETFPAWSVHDPAPTASPASGAKYGCGRVQAAIPLVASAPVVTIETEWLNQPPWSGTREVETAAAGAVASYLKA